MSASEPVALHLAGRRIEFPALEEAMPLLFFGAICLIGAVVLALVRTPISLGHDPFWWYIAGLGIVAMVGGLVSAHVPDESSGPVAEGDELDQGLVAVRRSDWEAWQVARGMLPEWFEGRDGTPETSVGRLDEIHEQFSAQPISAPLAEPRPMPASGPSPAVDPPPTADLPLRFAEGEAVWPTLAPALLGAPDPEAPSSMLEEPELPERASEAPPAVRTWTPIRCVGCDDEEILPGPAFQCATCGRGLCVECAAQAHSAAGRPRCPVCRSFEELEIETAKRPVLAGSATDGILAPAI